MVVGVLRHEAGHKEEAELVLPADLSSGKNPVQAVGSSLSYGQRYVAKLLLNLASRRRATRTTMDEAPARAPMSRTPSWRSTRSD